MDPTENSGLRAEEGSLKDRNLSGESEVDPTEDSGLGSEEGSQMDRNLSVQEQVDPAEGVNDGAEQIGQFTDPTEKGSDSVQMDYDPTDGTQGNVGQFEEQDSTENNPDSRQSRSPAEVDDPTENSGSTSNEAIEASELVKGTSGETHESSDLTEPDVGIDEVRVSEEVNPTEEMPVGTDGDISEQTDPTEGGGSDHLEETASLDPTEDGNILEETAIEGGEGIPNNEQGSEDYNSQIAAAEDPTEGGPGYSERGSDIEESENERIETRGIELTETEGSEYTLDGEEIKQDGTPAGDVDPNKGEGEDSEPEREVTSKHGNARAVEPSEVLDEPDEDHQVKSDVTYEIEDDTEDSENTMGDAGETHSDDELSEDDKLAHEVNDGETNKYDFHEKFDTVNELTEENIKRDSELLDEDLDRDDENTDKESDIGDSVSDHDPDMEDQDMEEDASIDDELQGVETADQDSELTHEDADDEHMYDVTDDEESGEKHTFEELNEYPANKEAAKDDLPDETDRDDEETDVEAELTEKEADKSEHEETDSSDQVMDAAEGTNDQLTDETANTDDELIDDGEDKDDEVTEGEADDDEVTEGEADDDEVTEGEADDDEVTEGEADDDEVTEGEADDDEVTDGGADDRANNIEGSSDKETGEEGREALEEEEELKSQGDSDSSRNSQGLLKAVSLLVVVRITCVAISFFMNFIDRTQSYFFLQCLFIFLVDALQSFLLDC